MENKIVRFSVILGLSILFSLAFWGASLLIGIIWYWWIFFIIWYGVNSILD